MPSSDSTASSRTFGGKRLHQEVVGSLVPGRFSFAALASASSSRTLQQQLAGLGGQLRGQFVIAVITLLGMPPVR